ncbi:hypothetical protein Tco_1255045, partial [Tanacetum coccineum]
IRSSKEVEKAAVIWNLPMKPVMNDGDSLYENLKDCISVLFWPGFGLLNYGENSHTCHHYTHILREVLMGLKIRSSKEVEKAAVIWNLPMKAVMNDGDSLDLNGLNDGIT